MRGERLAWFRVASHLRIPVEELAERITYREFEAWLEFLKWELNYHTKLDHYLAAIIAEVRRSYVKDPKKVKLEDLLLRFEDENTPKQDSKSVWMSLVGLKARKPPTRKTPNANPRRSKTRVR